MPIAQPVMVKPVWPASVTVWPPTEAFCAPDGVFWAKLNEPPLSMEAEKLVVSLASPTTTL